MSVWTLTHTPLSTGTPETRLIGGSEQPGDDEFGWGLEVADRVDRSLSADMVTLRYVPDDFTDYGLPVGQHVESAEGWHYGDRIAIYRDGSKWFEGEVFKEMRNASGSDHNIGWEIAGPWQSMEELTFFQLWGTTVQDDGEDPPVAELQVRERGDVTLMQEYNPVSGDYSVLKTGEQIHALADFATTRAGVVPLFQVADLESSGSGEPHPMTRGINVDFIKAQDDTVANLIRQLAKWTPGAVSWFDYETTPPTFHYSQPSGTDIINVDMDEEGDRRNVTIDISPNDELIVPYVKIAYRRIDTVDVEGEGSGSYENIIYDEFPANASDTVTDHRKALRATVDMDGANASIQVQKCKTLTIPYSVDGSNYNSDPPRDPPIDEPGSAQWRDQVVSFCTDDDRWPWLVDIVPAKNTDERNIGVVNFKVEAAEFVEGEEPDEDAGTPGTPLFPLYDTPRLLESGATGEWMNVKSQKVKITAELVFKGGARSKRNVRQYFNNPKKKEFEGTDAERFLPSVIGSWTVTATSAVTKSYERTTSQTEGEEPLLGIAESLYNQLATLQHSGTVAFEGDDFEVGEYDTNAFRPGMTLNITNANNDVWETMAATVQTVSQSFASRRTTLSLGVPRQLGLNDFITLARLWRNNPPKFTTQEERTTGKASSSSGDVEGPENTKVDGGSSDPPNSEENSFSVKCSDNIDSDGARDEVFKFSIAPGWVTSERAIVSEAPSTAEYEAIMPTLNDTPLDDADAPTQTVLSDLYIVYAKHEYDDDGVIESVKIEYGQELPSGGGGVGSDEYREIATIELERDARTNILEASVDQKVDSDYYWPSKIVPPSGGGGSSTDESWWTYTPQFGDQEMEITGTILIQKESETEGDQIPDEEWGIIDVSGSPLLNDDADNYYFILPEHLARSEAVTVGSEEFKAWNYAVTPELGVPLYEFVHSGDPTPPNRWAVLVGFVEAANGAIVSAKWSHDPVDCRLHYKSSDEISEPSGQTE